MPFNFLPDFNGNIGQIPIHIVALVGVVLLPYAIFLEQAHRKDLVRLVGAFCLLTFAIYKADTIFILSMGALCLASVVEFTEIMLGMHTHAPEDLKKYKKMWRHGKNSS